jgi:plastocyanin
MTAVTRRSVMIGLSAAAVLPAIAARAATDHAVAIQGMAFVPAALNVAVGDTVTFTNMDSAPHTATANDDSFETGKLSKGQSATVTIAAAGEHSYFCKIHRNMKGVISA